MTRQKKAEERVILPCQDPPKGIFSANELIWTEDIATFPANRLENFIDGEGRRDKTNETSFFIRNNKLSKSAKSNQIERKILWCSFGPHDTPRRPPQVIPQKGTYPDKGEGSRPRAVKKNFNNHTKRGCQCHFIVKRYKDAPDVIEVTYRHR
jgi:hypothetical protein